VLALATIRKLFLYNYWARDRQLEACAALSPDQFLIAGNSFPSMRDTLAHMVGAEWVWLERLQGRSPVALPPATEFSTLRRVSERWRVVERGFFDYLTSLREEQLSQSVAYTNFSAQNWSYTVEMILLHTVNHQTYHRGQVTMVLRQLGAQPAATDLLVAEDSGLFRRPQFAGLELQ
jgi:uncharacterized damage-inducible protein DinB